MLYRFKNFICKSAVYKEQKQQKLSWYLHFLTPFIQHWIWFSLWAAQSICIAPHPAVYCEPKGRGAQGLAQGLPGKRHSGGRTQAPDISGDCVVWWKVLADGGWGGRNQAPKLTNSGKKTPGFQKGGLKAASCSSPTTQTSRYFSLFHFFYLQASWIICSLPLPLMMLITPDQSTSLPFLLVLQSKYPVPLTLSQKFVRMETIL